MAATALSDPAIPIGSTILVTAANSLIGSHVVDQLLAAGYHVRGTVRTPSKCGWMEPLYIRRHGSGRFELVQVVDFDSPGAWDAAVRGVAGIAHVAGGADLFVQDFEAALTEELKIHIPLLEAAKEEPSVKSFVFTSSAWAAWTPDASRQQRLTEWTWNDEAIALARSNSPAEEKGIAPFMALKTRLEQEAWDWVKRETPAFAFNSILPDTVIGECLDPAGQGIPSTAGVVRSVWTGADRPKINAIAPQWHIDTRDTGRLYVAALVTRGVAGERLFGFAGRYSWFQVREILARLYPAGPAGRGEIAPVRDCGVDQTDVPNRRAEDLIRGLGLGQERWTSLEESVRANAKSFFSLGDRGDSAAVV